jgi:hypothetical protein
VEAAPSFIEVARNVDDLPYGIFGGIGAIVLWGASGRYEDNARNFEQTYEFIEHDLSLEQDDL